MLVTDVGRYRDVGNIDILALAKFIEKSEHKICKLKITVGLNSGKDKSKVLKMSCCDLFNNISYHLNKAEDCSCRNCSKLSGYLMDFDDSTKEESMVTTMLIELQMLNELQNLFELQMAYLF